MLVSLKAIGSCIFCSQIGDFGLARVISEEHYEAKQGTVYKHLQIMLSFTN